jgi:L,D-peptidoglycan transpeptidase YkuD (ErfK/YbiS/YcfS/YnhG family)
MQEPSIIAKKVEKLFVLATLVISILVLVPCFAECAQGTVVDEKMSATLDRISEGAGRVITAVPGETKEKAVVQAYEKKDNIWTLRFATEGFFGKNGVKADKREGDKCTPSGIYTFGRAFGVAEDPGSILPYTKVTDLDVWVDDVKSKYYNQWMSKNAPDADWDSVENLIEETVAYKYSISINYNTDPIVPGNGSAIFFHCSTGNGTAGCVSVPEEAMIFFLGFIDEKTRIAISGTGEI